MFTCAYAYAGILGLWLHGWGGDKGKLSFKPDVCFRQRGRIRAAGRGTLLTWEVTLWCYQELVCFYNKPQIDYHSLTAQTLNPISSGMFGLCSSQDRLHWEVLSHLSVRVPQ